MVNIKSKYNIILSLVALVVVIVAGIFLLSNPRKEEVIPDNTVGWKIFSDSANGLTFKYPENIPTTYIYIVDWPPKAEVVDGPFTCVPAGQETARAGQTTEQTIGGKIYCITKESEGAAGSTYTQYAYGTEIGNKVVFLTFTLRFVQCDNYDGPQKTACKNERAVFNINPIINQIAQTINLQQ